MASGQLVSSLNGQFVEIMEVTEIVQVINVKR